MPILYGDTSRIRNRLSLEESRQACAGHHIMTTGKMLCGDQCCSTQKQISSCTAWEKGQFSKSPGGLHRTRIYRIYGEYAIARRSPKRDIFCCPLMKR